MSFQIRWEYHGQVHYLSSTSYETANSAAIAIASYYREIHVSVYQGMQELNSHFYTRKGDRS